jgi:CBS domain-containing protein
MSVGALCNHNVVTIGAQADIAEAATALRQSHVGDVIVTELRQGRPHAIGIITDRDIVVEVLAQNVDPGTLTVGDVMSTDLLTLREDNSVETALREMARAGVRRAPVVASDQTLVGVLSVDDAIAHLATLMHHVANAIGSEQRIETESRP